MDAKIQQDLTLAKPQLQRGNVQHTMTDPQGSRASTRRSSLGCNYVLAPRPVEVLLAENSYLFSALHMQNGIRKRLTEQYTDFAVELAHYETPKQRRRLRKKLSLLRPKIAAAAEQEKAVFLRLSEVQIELESLNTWHQARAANMYARAMPSPGPTVSSLCSMSDTTSSTFSSCTTPLNANSPIFIPKRDLFELYPAETLYPTMEVSPELDTVEEASEEFSCNHDLLYQYQTCNGQEGERLVTWDGIEVKPRVRRSPSLPNLQCLWPSE